MFRFVLFSVLITCAYGNIIQRSLPGSRIVGGENTKIEKHPHQVAVLLSGSHTCGGSIISHRKILTAAHCCNYPDSLYTVENRVTKKGTSKEVFKVVKVIPHPSYNPRTLDNDACVLLLEREISFSNSAQPIGLAKEEPSAGSKAVITGWGTMKEGGSSALILQKVEVAIITRAACQDALHAYGPISNNMICAGVKKGGKDACQGDSGGPLVCDDKLVGIVSWGAGCARPGYPGVYTNVAALRNWIESQ